MWQTVILTGMLAMVGFYTVKEAVVTQSSETTQSTSQSTSQSLDLASSMAVYRQSIIDHLRENPELLKNLQEHPELQSVTLPTREIQASLPSWYVLPKDRQSRPLWSHCICPDGTVIIFANQPMKFSITQDLLKISKNSITVGESIGNTLIYSPGIAKKLSKSEQDNNTETATSQVTSNGNALAGNGLLSSCTSIAAGRPVWIAKLN